MTSRLSEMQARFQQKQMQEKEEKLLKLYENQQQRAFDRVGRSSAGSNATLVAGKVRQMFDERRQKAGIDRSYPLEPIKNRNGGSLERKTTKTIVNAKKIVKTSTRIYNDDENNEDLVELMNRHNLNESLDDEELPEIENFDEDEVYEDEAYEDEVDTVTVGKLPNVGGKLPSENTIVKKSNLMTRNEKNSIEDDTNGNNTTRGSTIGLKNSVNNRNINGRNVSDKNTKSRNISDKSTNGRDISDRNINGRNINDRSIHGSPMKGAPIKRHAINGSPTKNSTFNGSRTNVRGSLTGSPTTGSPTTGSTTTRSPTTGSPTTGSPTTASPARRSPTKASHTKGSPTKVGPIKGSPSRASLMKNTPIHDRSTYGSNGSPTRASPSYDRSTNSPKTDGPINNISINDDSTNDDSTSGAPINGAPINGAPINGDHINGEPIYSHPINGDTTDDNGKTINDGDPTDEMLSNDHIASSPNTRSNIKRSNSNSTRRSTKVESPSLSNTMKKRVESKPLLKSNVITKKTSPTDSVQSTPSKMSAKQQLQSGDRAQSGRRAPSAVRPSSTRSAARPPLASVQRDDLVACRFCQRRFATDRIQTHEDICARTAKKKRKAYDATKHRIGGTEMEPYVRKSTKVSAKSGFNSDTITHIKASKHKPVKAAPSKSNWRQKHEEFISSIRAAKQAQVHVAKGGNLRDLPPPPPSSNPDYVQCPHCGRRFNESAATRHIPKCASYQYNKPKPGPPKR